MLLPFSEQLERNIKKQSHMVNIFLYKFYFAPSWLLHCAQLGRVLMAEDVCFHTYNHRISRSVGWAWGQRASVIETTWAFHKNHVFHKNSSLSWAGSSNTLIALPLRGRKGSRLFSSGSYENRHTPLHIPFINFLKRDLFSCNFLAPGETPP